MAYAISKTPPKASSQPKNSTVASAAIPGMRIAATPATISRTPHVICQPRPVVGVVASCGIAVLALSAVALLRSPGTVSRGSRRRRGHGQLGVREADAHDQQHPKHPGHPDT